MARRPKTCTHRHPQSQAVWSLSDTLVWLELGHPSCQKLGMPAGHG